MVDSQFFYDWEERSYTIEKSVLEKIKNLKSKVEESSYYDDMVKWYFDETDGTDEELQDLWITMQFLTMTAEPSVELIEKYNLTEKKYLVNLMRQLYLDADTGRYDEGEGNSIMMGYKRPFGNSHVEGDVREELEICGVIEKKDEEDEDYDDYLDDYDYGLEREVLKEFANFIMDFFAGGFELRWYGFEKAKEGGSGFSPRRDYDVIEAYWKSFGMDRIHSHMTQWKPAKSELRAIVLDKLLEDDV
jgi:hypothetical protein